MLETDLGHRYDERIKTLGEYHPYSSFKFNEYSRLILDFKEGKYHAVRHFFNQISSVLDVVFEENVLIKIATIPSSQPNNPKAGFRELFLLIKDRYKHRIQNEGINNLLERTCGIPKQTSLGRSERNFAQHLNSLRPVGVKRGDKVVLLDDVITTSCSMKSGIFILENAGAKVLCGIGLAKTVH